MTAKANPLALYAEMLRATVSELRALGVTQIPHHDLTEGPTLRIHHRNERGEVVAALFVDVDTGVTAWLKVDKKPRPAFAFGIDRAVRASPEHPLLLVRDVHEAIACQLADMPAVAIHDWASLPAFAATIANREIHVLVGDLGAETVDLWRQRLPTGRVRLLCVDRLRTPWSTTGHDARRFRRAIHRTSSAAPHLHELSSHADAVRREELRSSCGHIAESPDVLAAFLAAIHKQGLVGVDAQTQLLYLQLTSRLLADPLSVALRAGSSVGKSAVVSGTLAFFPDSAFLLASSMSDHALAYSSESLVNRILVIAEADGMKSEVAQAAVRTLISERKLKRLAVVPREGERGQTEAMEIEGPMGLLTTHTMPGFEAQLETRILTLSVPDSAAQTAAIMAQQAARAERGEDVGDDYGALQPWRDFQELLALSPARVTVPYAIALQRLLPKRPARMNRDFPKLLTLIKSHALLHQQTRGRTESDSVIATIDDYAAVRRIAGQFFAETMHVAVPAEVRQAVGAVADLLMRSGKDRVSHAELGQELGLDAGAVAHRVEIAVARNYLDVLPRNGKVRPGLAIGDDMPEDRAVLPSASRLRTEIERASVSGEPSPPPSPRRRVSRRRAAG